jgi:hypothetical protein
MALKMYRETCDAWTVAAMIAEDADREQIFARVDQLDLSPEQAREFVAALKLSTLTLPIPWYRPDISGADRFGVLAS